MLRLPIQNNYLYCGLQFSVPFAALYHTGDGDAASASTRASAAYFTMGPAADNGALEYRPEKTLTRHDPKGAHHCWDYHWALLHNRRREHRRARQII